MDEDLAIFLEDFLEMLSGFEDAISKMKQQLAKLVGVGEMQWRVIEAQKPVDPADRAIRWLERKLAEIKGKHPELLYEFSRDSSGLVTGLRYRAADAEVQEDVEAVTRWALEKAAQRPVQG
ncbi:MAG: hypothetical protein QW160_03700 [Candidatus Bathyarchaeia archaeon]